MGRKTGLVRSAVVLFPPTGERDRKYAEREREVRMSGEGCGFKMAEACGRRIQPDVLFLWSCSSPWTSVVLIHPGSVSKLGIRLQNPSSKSHRLCLAPLTENTVHRVVASQHHKDP